MTDISDHSSSPKISVLSSYKHQKVVVVWVIAAVVVVGFTTTAFFWLKSNSSTESNEAKDTISNSYSEDVAIKLAEKDSAVQATKLKANPPAARALSSEKAEYYTQLVATLHDNGEIIATYEQAKSQNVTLPSESLVIVATAYAKRNEASDKQTALLLLTEARQYVKSHGEDVDNAGVTTGQLEWIDGQQKEMGL